MRALTRALMACLAPLLMLGCVSPSGGAGGVAPTPDAGPSEVVTNFGDTPAGQTDAAGGDNDTTAALPDTAPPDTAQPDSAPPVDTVAADTASPADGGSDAGVVVAPDAGADVADPCDCTGFACGFLPGCTASCGTCADGGVCKDNQCQIDPCDCAGKQCGSPAGCANVCGTCNAGEKCVAHKCEVDPCSCGGKQCGFLPGCPQSCGTCPAGVKCAANQCKVDPCSCAGKQCGFIPGCPMSCGACPLGKKCVTNTCIDQGGNKLKKLGEFCGPTASCQPPWDDSDDKAYDKALSLYWQCLNAQCAGGTCLGNICTQQCKIKKDEVDNATGIKGADGIEDTSVNFSDCTGAVAGPVGKNFRCVEYRSEAEVSQGQSLQFCYAGSAFKHCKSNGDCAAGESCQFKRIYGKYSTRCMPAYSNPDKSPGAKVSELCNDNIVQDAIALCAGGICTGIGCRTFCKSDADCNTAPAGACKAGKCSTGAKCSSDADCSVWECKKGVTIYSDLKDTFDLCGAKACKDDKACPADFFCRLSYNGVTKPGGDPDPKNPGKLILPDWENICQRRRKSGVAPGLPCDAYPHDMDKTFKPCQTLDWYCAMGNGVCGNLCASDADCAANMKCPALEFAWDLDQDNEDETFLETGLCANTKGNVKSVLCYSNNDCKGASSTGQDQVCQAWSLHINDPTTPPGAPAKKVITSGGLCVDGDAKKGKFGDFCGNDASIKHCSSGTCLSLASGAGLCTDLCAKRSDCTDPVAIQGQTYKAYCMSLNIGGYNGTVAPFDDYRRAYCLWTDSSVDDCSATKSCKAKDESCLARVMVWGMEKAANVEYWCNRVENSGQVGLPPPKNPDKTLGAECDLESELIQCKTLYCLRDVKPGKGYCSAPCNTDKDCGVGLGLYCNKANMGFPGVPRKDKSKAAIVPMCMKKKSCIVCEYDYQCAGGYLCTNLGGAGNLAKQRCAPTCKTDQECAGTDGGPKCLPQVDAQGKATAVKVCKPGC